MPRPRNYSDHGDCPEPPGQEQPLATEGDARNAHSIYIDEQGQCPWCGMLEPLNLQERG